MTTSEKKERLIHLINNENISLREISRRLGVNLEVVRTWLAIYRYHGAENLLHPHCTPYPESFKMKVLKYTVETADTMVEIAGKFNIPSRATIWKWMKKYLSKENWSLYYLKREWRDQMKKEQSKELTKKEQSKLKQLEQENELLKAENAYLKKLRALVQEKEKQ